MIRFLYGNDREKADAALLGYLKEHAARGERAVLLVPEQETVSAERRMVTALPPSAQLTFEVSNFTRLANRIFRHVGGLGYRYATPAVEKLLMWHTLRHLAPRLTEYGEHAAANLHLCDLMLAAVSQFKAYCVSPEKLAEATQALGSGDPLGQKLADLSLVFATYEGELYRRFADAKDDVSRATKLLVENKSLFSDTHVYISSFTDFTGQELQMIRALMEICPSLTVALPLSRHGDTGIHLASAAATEERLFQMAKALGKTVNSQRIAEEKPKTALEILRRDLFDLNKDSAPMGLAEGGEIVLTVAANPYEEAEYAATLIAEAVRGGARYRDFVLILRDATDAVGIIDASLEREGIPFYLSERTDVTVRPLIKLLLFALRIKRYGWKREDVVGYLKTGLTGIPADDVNLFEEYAEVWHIGGRKVFESPFTMNPDGYADRTSSRAVRILEGANRARAAFTPELCAYFEALDGAETATDLAAATYDFLLSLNVPETMKARAVAHLEAGERREAEESTRLWGVVVDALETLGQTLGDQPLDVAAFADALMLVFKSTDIGAIPTSADEVMIGSAATLRADPPRFAVVMGLNDGVFPRVSTDKGLLSDAEKRRLKDLGIELSANLATTASDELFYVHRALSLPRERLYLSYTKTASDGRALEPSIAITRVKALFPWLKDAADYGAKRATDKMFTREAAILRLRELSSDEREAVLPLLCRSKGDEERIENLSLPVTDTDASVTPARAATLFPDSSFSPTRLEQFVSCKFAYYCDRILRLRREPTDTLDAAAVGTFIHYVLEKTLAAITGGDKEFADYTEEEVDAIVCESVAAYRAHLLTVGGGITPRAEGLLSRLTSLARIVVSSLIAEFADSRFRPAFFELDLSGGDNKTDVKGRDGVRIPLSGKVDRVDYYRAEDGEVYLRVADYKTGQKTFEREDIAKGYSLQMPLYLMALCEGKHPMLAKKLGLPPHTSFKPAGVTYLSTAVGNETTKTRIEKSAALKSAASRLKRNGLLPDSEELLNAISLSNNKDILGSEKTRKERMLSTKDFEALFEELTDTVSRIAGEMKSGAATIAPTTHNERTPCRFCAYAAVCRAADKKD